jgi:HEAT repeat protein
VDGTAAASLANDWLKEFCFALRNVGLYSPVHPRARASVDRAFERLQAMLALRGEIVLARSEGRAFVGEFFLDRDRLLSRQITDVMSARGIDCIAFLPEITGQDHLGLLRSLLLAPERIQERGGFDRVLEEEGVRSVQIDRQQLVRAGSDAESLRYAALVELLARFRATPASSLAGPDATPIATTVVSGDPDALGRALVSAARDARQAGSPVAIAAFVAATLEALADRAIAERVRDREEILGSVGLAVVGCAPETHVPLFVEHGGPRSAYKHVAEAIQSLEPAAIGDLVALHYPRVIGDYHPLSEMLNRTSAWRGRRADALAAAAGKLARLGVGQEEYRELVARLLWTELDDDRRLALLHRNDYLWRADSELVGIALTSLLDAGRTEDAAHLVERLLQGLSSPDATVRRRVAGDVSAIVEAVERAGGGREALRGIAQSLIVRLAVERDDDVADRIVAGLAGLFAARIHAAEYGLAIEILRDADRLSDSRDPSAGVRGCLLAAALAAAIDAETSASLTRVALDETSPLVANAVEILSRTSVPQVVQDLAEEESRPRRARLIGLLKEIAARSWRPLLAVLDDPRWYVVRNVVSILGEVADDEALPEMLRASCHHDARVRKEAVRALARFGAPESERRILSALADGDRRVRIAAVHALSALQGNDASDALVKLCEKSPPYQAVTEEVRQEAILGLARSGSSEAYAVLARLLGKKGILGRGETVEVRVAAARALGSVGTPDAIALLAELARKDSRERVREAAALALQRRDG